MAFTCNINRTGRGARIVMGVVGVLIGITFAWFVARPSDAVWPWAVVVACLSGGAFGIFEGAIGWCAARAMGFKTRI